MATSATATTAYATTAYATTAYAKTKIIVLCGYQGSGKSTYTEKCEDCLVISNDTMDKKINIRKLLETTLASGEYKSVIIDNTNLTKKSRKNYVDLAKEFGIEIELVWIDSKIENCMIRVLRRQCAKFKKLYLEGISEDLESPHIFPPAALFRARKIFEKPELSEGFSKITKLPEPPIEYKGYINRAIFFDIDGTLRKTSHLPNKYPIHPSEVELIADVSLMRSIIQKYRALGYKFFGVSNQSGIAKGILSEEDCEACMERTRELLDFRDLEIQWCSHASFPINCYCRKPQSGLGIYFIERYKVNPYESLMVGDMTTDKTFAERLGIKYIAANKFWI
jgi:HAD superfamily hydrolase (TIGR01662 family)